MSKRNPARETTENDPRGTHTDKHGRQAPNNPRPLAEEYERQHGHY